MDIYPHMLYIKGMRWKRYILIICGILLPLGLQSQGERYHHPVYDISFEASPNWTGKYVREGGSSYALINPNQNMVISMDYVPECNNPMKYLRKLSGLKGLVCLRDGYDTVLNDQEALIMYGNCLQSRESYSSVVIAFPSNGGLYLMQISCPEECKAHHQQKLQSILKTVRIGGNSYI